ncbi:MAG: hypothetical protein AAGA38_02450 [Pseudomonadota bacterium]
MRRVHAIAVSSVFLLIWAVASVLATGQDLSTSALLSELSASIVWIVAGGIALLSIAQEACTALKPQKA